jgi:hypothetical protein
VRHASAVSSSSWVRRVVAGQGRPRDAHGIAWAGDAWAGPGLDQVFLASTNPERTLTISDSEGHRPPSQARSGRDCRAFDDQENVPADLTGARLADVRADWLLVVEFPYFERENILV